MKIWTILLRTRNLCTPQEQLPDFLSATTAAKRISSTKISTCLSDLRWHYYQNAEYISCDSCDTKTHFHQRKSWRFGILVASASERSTFGSNYELTIYQSSLTTGTPFILWCLRGESFRAHLWAAFCERCGEATCGIRVSLITASSAKSES